MGTGNVISVWLKRIQTIIQLRTWAERLIFVGCFQSFATVFRSGTYPTSSRQEQYFAHVGMCKSQDALHFTITGRSHSFGSPLTVVNLQAAISCNQNELLAAKGWSTLTRAVSIIPRRCDLTPHGVRRVESAVGCVRDKADSLRSLQCDHFCPAARVRLHLVVSI